MALRGVGERDERAKSGRLVPKHSDGNAEDSRHRSAVLTEGNPLKFGNLERLCQADASAVSRVPATTGKDDYTDEGSIFPNANAGPLRFRGCARVMPSLAGVSGRRVGAPVEPQLRS